MIPGFIHTALHSLRHQKLSQDIAYSIGSFFVLAVSGIVINIVITASRDAASLGVFNLAYAVYIVASQFAAWGLHYSVLRHAAYIEDSAERGALLCTAALCTLVTGGLAAAALVIGKPLFAQAFGSQVTGEAIRNAAFGLSLFPLNKVLLAFLNGMRHMKAFALLQGMRYLVVMLLVCAVVLSDAPIESATFCFLVAEVITAVGACAYIWRARMVAGLSLSLAWVRKHFAFGTKGLAAGMFAEVNSRIDVLMIGFFLDERATGIYSFAAMLVDGLYHVLAMIRINFNPMLVSALRDKDYALASNLRLRSRQYVLPATVFLAASVMAVYLAAAVWIMPGKGLEEGLGSLAVLLLGLVTVSILVPFDNLMMVSGHPGYQTGQQLATVTANVAIAAVCLPLLGIEGAALGTAGSYWVSTAMLVFFSRRVVGWNLVTNRFRT